MGSSLGSGVYEPTDYLGIWVSADLNETIFSFKAQKEKITKIKIVAIPR